MKSRVIDRIIYIPQPDSKPTCCVTSAIMFQTFRLRIAATAILLVGLVSVYALAAFESPTLDDYPPISFCELDEEVGGEEHSFDALLPQGEFCIYGKIACLLAGKRELPDQEIGRSLTLSRGPPVLLL